MLVQGLVLVASPLGYDRGIISIKIDITVESSIPIYKRSYYRCVYFMRREFHLFAIISILTRVWTLGPDRVVWTYLHLLLPFLQLAPRSNEGCTVHGWSGR